MQTTYEIELEQIVQSIFATMLNIEVVRVDEQLVEEPKLVTSIQISGGWMGSVILGLSAELAASAAATLLGMPISEVTAADEQDTASELVNMIGGNLKSLLPGPSSLSLPTIVSGQNFDVRISGAELIDDVTLASEVGPLRIRVFNKPL